MVVGQLLITSTVEICIWQLGGVEEIARSPYGAIQPLRRAGLSAAAETLVILMVQIADTFCKI